MSKLRGILNSAVSGVSPVIQDYAESFPSASAIAAQCGPDEVSELIALINYEAEARDRVDTVDGDELDSCWRAMQRLSGVLDELASSFPEVLMSGLSYEHSSTRLYVALAMKRARLPEFIPALQACLDSEKSKLTRKALADAVAACAPTNFDGAVVVREVGESQELSLLSALKRFFRWER